MEEIYFIFGFKEPIAFIYYFYNIYFGGSVTNQVQYGLIALSTLKLVTLVIAQAHIKLAQ